MPCKGVDQGLEVKYFSHSGEVVTLFLVLIQRNVSRVTRAIINTGSITLLYVAPGHTAISLCQFYGSSIGRTWSVSMASWSLSCAKWMNELHRSSRTCTCTGTYPVEHTRSVRNVIVLTSIGGISKMKRRYTAFIPQVARCVIATFSRKRINANQAIYDGSISAPVFLQYHIFDRLGSYLPILDIICSKTLPTAMYVIADAASLTVERELSPQSVGPRPSHIRTPDGRP